MEQRDGYEFVIGYLFIRLGEKNDLFSIRFKLYRFVEKSGILFLTKFCKFYKIVLNVFVEFVILESTIF